MVLVSVLYAITWFPSYVYVLLVHQSPNFTFFDTGYSVSMFIAFSYNCINPFIYATKLEPVKEVLLRMIPCKKITEEATENVAMTASTRAAGTVT